MMQENNDILLAGGDALTYLAEPMHKKYSTTFVWDHPFSTYVFYDWFFNPLPQYALYTFWMIPLHFPSCVRT